MMMPVVMTLLPRMTMNEKEKTIISNSYMSANMKKKYVFKLKKIPHKVFYFFYIFRAITKVYFFNIYD